LSLQTDDAATVSGLVAEAQEPVVPDHPDTIFDLPGGLLDASGDVLKQVIIKELTGADEEALSRATRKGGVFDPFVYIRAVVERGVESIGGRPANPDMLDRLYIGDRDAIALMVRIATYGGDYEMHYVCPRCSHEGDVVVELDKDIPSRSLDSPEWWRTIDLPRGRKAIAHLVTVADQTVAMSDDARTNAEVDTVIFSRVVKELDGQIALGEQTFRDAKAGDRKAIRNFLVKTQPGPQMGEVKGECPACNEELPLPLSLPALFL
jgi:hypothetical protein